MDTIGKRLACKEVDMRGGALTVPDLMLTMRPRRDQPKEQEVWQ